MKLPFHASLLAVLALVPMAAACGGKVVIEGASSDQEVDVPTLCAMHCAAVAAAGCPFPNQELCSKSCTTLVGYAGKCAPASIAVLECLANASAEQLCGTAGCEEELAQREACVYPPGGCSTSDCKGTSENEHCTKTCGANVYETTCTGSTGSWSCTCIANGSTAGTCTDTETADGRCCDGTFADL
ncbi:hypothetical protein A7982_12654 [Minicystis rosea]|nr:hypothetical protein A7982_12654 [Minicystis rosea]